MYEQNVFCYRNNNNNNAIDIEKNGIMRAHEKTVWI